MCRMEGEEFGRWLQMLKRNESIGKGQVCEENLSVEFSF